jgi:hypothetical protein
MLASNLGQVRPTVGYRAMLVVLTISLTVLFILRLLLRDWAKAGLITSLGLLLFFSYGHAYNALRSVEIGGTTLGRHRYLLPVAVILGGAGVWLLWKRGQAISGLTPVLNLAIGLVLLIPLMQIVAFQLGGRGATGAAQTTLPAFKSIENSELPDIYYIILDGYTSEAVLRDTYGLDNSPFLDELRELGFYVADCSLANYAQTELSLVSTLNMSYLDRLIDETNPDRAQLWPLLRHSSVRSLLEQLGYKTIAFETGYYWSEWEDADQYLAPVRGPLQGMSAFEATLLRSTAAWAFIDALPELPAFLVRDLDRSADSHRERLLYVFDQLEKLPFGPGPKFVFAHIVSPHRPFVFDAEGSPIDDDYDWTQSSIGLDAYKTGYREQVQYVNRRIEKIVNEIIERSEVPPVIVIQGDHGPEEGSSQDRMSILNAQYLGGGDSGFNYASISPVNTFRTLFSNQLSADLEPIDDNSYFSVYDDPYSYSEITNECPR